MADPNARKTVGGPATPVDITKDSSGLITQMIALLTAIAAGAVPGVCLDEILKIDSAAVDGLLGVEDSLAYKVHELERHFHNVERWWGTNGAATETNAIAAGVDNPFVVVSGANTWGAAIPILGTADDPNPLGEPKFDIHRLQIVDIDDDTSLWRIRIIWGTGTSAAAIAAEQWTEAPVIANAVPGNRAGGVPVAIMMRRRDVGTKLWAQAWNDTDGEAVSLQWGAHPYPG